MGPQRVCPFPKSLTLHFTTSAESSLPIWYHDKKHSLHKVSEDTGKFFTDDLDVSRLDRIQEHFIGLRLAGRYKAVARPLHRQLMVSRRVIVTEQADLHLTWDHAGIYIKPLPAYIFDEKIWAEYLCKSSSLYESACGLLLSYVWLITHESDFRLAVGYEIPLLPLSEHLTWTIRCYICRLRCYGWKLRTLIVLFRLKLTRRRTGSPTPRRQRVSASLPAHGPQARKSPKVIYPRISVMLDQHLPCAPVALLP